MVNTSRKHGTIPTAGITWDGISGSRDMLFIELKSLSVGLKFHEPAQFHATSKWHSYLLASSREFIIMVR